MIRRLLLGRFLIEGVAKMLKALCVFCVVSCCLASDVIELNDKNFDAIVKSNKFLVVEFYTNW